MSTDAYLRHPHINDDLVAFVAEDDIWVAGRDGGRAYRVSADHVPVATPRISPDGSMVAWTARRDGAVEVYVARVDGGVSTRLTYWGQPRTTVVGGWLNPDEVLVFTAAGEAEPQRCFAHAVPVDGRPSRRLPYGWANQIAFGPDGGVLLRTTSTVEPAWWKGYRGGTAGQLWLDLDGSGEFKRIFNDIETSLICPLWTSTPSGRQRLGFISDHEGRGQVYSATVGKRAPSTSRLTRHTDHADYYARHASSDGTQVVYVAGGTLYLLDSLDEDAESRPVDVRLGGARPALQPRSITPTARKFETVRPDRTGRASAVEIRGTIQWLTHRDGPVKPLASGSECRRRLPAVLGNRVAWVTDAAGDDGIEIVSLDEAGATPRTLVPAGRIGRVLEMVGSPDGRRLALATHDGRLLTLTVPDGEITRAARLTELDSTDNGDMSGLAFSPDSQWLAWSAPAADESDPAPLDPHRLRQIRLARLGGRNRPIDVTPVRFTDTDPVFTKDGKHLAFLSIRSLDPVYDAFVFDLSFPNGCRPHIVPLAADTPSPFDPRLSGRPAEGAEERDSGDAGSKDDEQVPETRVDADGLHQRVVAVPVAGGRYSHLESVRGGLIWLKLPLKGELGEDLPKAGAEPARASLEHIDLVSGKLQTLADAADSVAASGDGKQLVVSDGDDVKVVPATRKADRPDDGAADDATVDLSRLRVEVNPPAEWTQMYHETWRLMRDHFWRADMNGVDWEAARDRYAPLLRTIGSHDDLVDLIWEMHGELGSSHAYCMPPQDDVDPGRRLGLLGADLELDGDVWRIRRVVPGEPSMRQARSPLLAPGVGAVVGDAVVAVDGRPTGPTVSPAQLLVGKAEKPVEITLAPAAGGSARRVVVVPLADEFPLRYQDWVNDRRRYVHERTGGRVGYLHVPDMVSAGWAQLHRDLRTEVGRDALIVDVRANGGGHTSQLVVEKLARRIIGWDVSRGYPPESYPSDARRGPMVAVTDMYAGSDGDIVTAAIQSLGLGPVVGTRTWGGVIGIDGRYQLVDGTSVTQPRYSFWFDRFGWGVENYGVAPDVEVVAAPQDRVARTDVQLDHALVLVERELKRTPALQPPPLPDPRQE